MAVRWTGDNQDSVDALVGKPFDTSYLAEVGDWIILGPDGLSSCSPVKFERNYELFSKALGLLAFADEVHRLAAKDGFCPNFGEATESCDCIVCRALTLIAECEDHPLFDPTSAPEKPAKDSGQGDAPEAA